MRSRKRARNTSRETTRQFLMEPQVSQRYLEEKTKTNSKIIIWTISCKIWIYPYRTGYCGRIHWVIRAHEKHKNNLLSDASASHDLHFWLLPLHQNHLPAQRCSWGILWHISVYRLTFCFNSPYLLYLCSVWFYLQIQWCVADGYCLTAGFSCSLGLCCTDAPCYQRTK